MESKDTQNFALGLIVAAILFLLFRSELNKLARRFSTTISGGGSRGGASYASGGGGAGGAGAGSHGGGGCGCGCGGGKVIPFTPQTISIGGQSYDDAGSYGNSVAAPSSR